MKTVNYEHLILPIYAHQNDIKSLGITFTTSKTDTQMRFPNGVKTLLLYPRYL